MEFACTRVLILLQLKKYLQNLYNKDNKAAYKTPKREKIVKKVVKFEYFGYSYDDIIVIDIT